jgi:hypothetical protein
VTERFPCKRPCGRWRPSSMRRRAKSKGFRDLGASRDTLEISHDIPIVLVNFARFSPGRDGFAEAGQYPCFRRGIRHEDGLFS